MERRYKVQFPPTDASQLAQDEAFFYLKEDGDKRRVRLHDYDAIFRIPGLYEQVVYDRLKCQSPTKVAEILEQAVGQENQSITELRVLDFGAGNGAMGEALCEYGVARLVGADIIDEAREAADRDRPGLYDAYYVEDFCKISPSLREDLETWSLNCLTTVAALGFGDIPPLAFLNAMNLIQEQGWVAFNIKETFLDNSDSTGFSTMIRELIFSEYLDLYYLERYRHRISLDGEPLYYFALAARKTRNVPMEFLEGLGARS